MTRHSLSPGSRRSQGFSLIELLVSMTIGLIIVAAAGSAYLGASSAGKVADAQSRMNEDAQAALNILTQHLRMAGNNPIQGGRAAAFRNNPIFDPTYVGGTSTAYPSMAYTVSPTTYTTSNFSIVGCDGKFSNLTTTTLADLACAGGTTTLPDSIAVSYEADRYNTVPTAAGLPTDCIGQTLNTVTATFSSPAGTQGTFTVADSRFYIGTSTGIVSPSLYCKGNGGTALPTTAQPLVENIEDMQFTYGTVSTTNTSTTATVAGYLPAEQVVNETNLALLPLADRWGKVLSVRICILVRSETFSAPDAASARYDDCQGARNVAAPDLRLRRAYSTTVVLRNRRF